MIAIKSPVKIFSLIIFLTTFISAQKLKENVNSVNHTESDVSSLNAVKKISIIKQTEDAVSITAGELFRFEYYNRQNQITKEDFKLDVISSFRNNIKFGGFWDKYTIINLTPQMYITPADFISVYAVHNMSFFVPIEKVRQNFKSMALRGAAIMVVDNSVNMLLGKSKVLGPVVGFLVKNVLIYSINKIEKDTDIENNLMNYDYNYYSVSIRF